MKHVFHRMLDDISLITRTKRISILLLRDPGFSWVLIGQPTHLGMAIVSLIFTLPTLLLCLGMCEREKILNPMAHLNSIYHSSFLGVLLNIWRDNPYATVHATDILVLLTQALMVACLQKIDLLPHLGSHIVHTLNVQVRN